MMQYKAVAGAMRAWLPCAGSSLSQFVRATTGSNPRRTTPGLPMSEAESVEKQDVGEESGRMPRAPKSEAESVEEQEVGEESGEEEEARRRAPPKDPGTVEEFLLGGMEETPLAPTPLRSPFLKHTEASPPIEPFLQQKRRLHTIDRRVLEEAVCAGLDGSPPKGAAAESNQEHDENEDEHPDIPLNQKPSPLSEIEFVDTRFPISQALDSEVTREPIEEEVGFAEEQLDTVEGPFLEHNACLMKQRVEGSTLTSLHQGSWLLLKSRKSRAGPSLMLQTLGLLL